VFYTIAEEDDEEDSFERDKKLKRERMQSDYEKKIEELERVHAGSFF